MTHACIKLSSMCVLLGWAATGIGAVQAQQATKLQLSARAATVPAAMASRVSPQLRSVADAPLLAWPTVNDRRLDSVRGGFDVGRGLLVSFGFERVVYVNGDLVSRTKVDIADVGQMTPAQASALAALGTVNVIQNGAGNRFDPSAFRQATAATVIQNSLDNQSLQSLTTINATVNSLDDFRSRNLQDSLHAGLIGSLGY